VRRTRRLLTFAAVAGVSVGLVACGAQRGVQRTSPTQAPPRPSTAIAPKATTPGRTTPAPLTTASLPRGASLVAVARARRLSVHATPAARRPFLVLSDKTAHGEPATFLVKRTQGAWVRISLARRPNGSSGWVKRSAVTLLVNFYRLKIDLTAHRLTLFRSGRVAERIPIGVGKALTPTPTGVYFIVELLRTPDPTGLYGPYAFGLSAYSTVLTQFGAGGKGEIGLHGTNHPELLGQDVSHGCIRIANRDITLLSKILPLGTPVEIAR